MLANHERYIPSPLRMVFSQEIIDQEQKGAQREYESFETEIINIATRAPRGNGREVTLIPGITLNNQYLAPLKECLQLANYVPQDLGETPNYPSLAHLLMAEKRVLQSVNRTGNKAIVWGHSLGGVMARIIAFAHPDKVQMVIASASPIGEDENGDLNITAERLLLHRVWFDILRHGSTSLPKKISAPLPEEVQGVSIYVPGDKIISTRSSIDPNSGAINFMGNGFHGDQMFNRKAVPFVLKELARRPLFKAASVEMC